MSESAANNYVMGHTDRERRRIDLGGAESPYHEWFTDSLRSVLPRAQALGIAGTAEIDIDTLESRLRDEALANGSVLPSVAMIGVTARKP